MKVEPGEFTDRIGARFVKIPGRDYCIGRCTVTQKGWTAVMGTEPWKEEEYVKEGDDFPATFISWHDSCEFVEKLNEIEDREMYRFPPRRNGTMHARREKQGHTSLGTM